MDKSTTGLLGAAFGMSIGILLIFAQGNHYLDSPAYYKEYYSDKKECERLLPRNQECYTVITWETKEIEDE